MTFTKNDLFTTKTRKHFESTRLFTPKSPRGLNPLHHHSKHKPHPPDPDEHTGLHLIPLQIQPQLFERNLHTFSEVIMMRKFQFIFPNVRFSISFGVRRPRRALTMFPAIEPALSHGTDVAGIANTYQFFMTDK